MPDSMDWVKADVRTCDGCGRETDAGEYPEWPEGICEDCDPSILDSYFDCDDCAITLPIDNVKIVRRYSPSTNDFHSVLMCVGCYSERLGVSNA